MRSFAGFHLAAASDHGDPSVARALLEVLSGPFAYDVHLPQYSTPPLASDTPADLLRYLSTAQTVSEQSSGVWGAKIPAFACTPVLLPDSMAAATQRKDLNFGQRSQRFSRRRTHYPTFVLAPCSFLTSSGRVKTIKRVPLGIINISVAPHDDRGKVYLDLFRNAYSLDKIVKIRGDEYAYIASCVSINTTTPSNGLTGEIRKYTAIDTDWENLKLRKAATQEDLKEVNIPEHLKPNRESFRYFFFPLSHRLVFQLRGAKRSISPSAVAKLFQSILSDERLKKQFPLISVVVEPETDSVERIFSLPHLRRLTVEIFRPNPGEGFSQKEAREVEQLLEQQNASEMLLTLKNAPGQSLEPNKDVRMYSRVASSYGRVVADGRNEQNRPVTIDTSDHPMIVDFDYDKSKQVGFVDQMLSAARDAVQKLFKRTTVVKKNERS